MLDMRLKSLISKQNSDISEEQDEIDGVQQEANTTIAFNSSGSTKPLPGNPI